MTNTVKQFKRVIRQVSGLFPTPLPLGMPRFQEWAKEIAETYQMPTEDQRSITYALATMIMHLGPGVDSRSKYSFAKELRASAAKQVAGATFQDLKLQQQAEAKALADSQQLDVVVSK